MTPAELRVEIQAHAADPVIADGLATSNDIAVAARLSELLTEIRPVPINKLAAWGAANGLRARLQDHAENPASALRSIALAALDLLRGNMAPTFDTLSYAPLLDALQQGGALSVAERATLTAIATQPRIVSANEVAAAVRNDDGSPK